MQVREINLAKENVLAEMFPQVQSTNIPEHELSKLPKVYSIRDQYGRLLGLISDDKLMDEILTLVTYQQECIKTESIVGSLWDSSDRRINARLLHAAMGLVTEAAEILDHMKKYIFYGRNLDETNLLEEGGDIEWYMSILLDELKAVRSQIFKMNIAKLQKVRYRKGFSTEEAIERNLEEERKVLETYKHA